MNARYPVAYVRRSTADDSNPGDVSREAQEAAVRALAARDGHNGELRLFVDWGRSADEEKEAKRAAFLAMLAAIERGEVSTVYAYALDRLYRSMRTFVRLTDAARARDVRIVTQREGVLGGDGSPMARAFAEITAVFASLELNTIKARNQGAAKARRSRGDAMGQPPYGKRIVRDADGRAIKPIRWEDDPERPLAPILKAYSQCGNVLATAKALSAAGVPTPKGKVKPDGSPRWETTSLTLILERAGVLPPRHHRRLYAKSAYLAGLIRCHCHNGKVMTPDHEHVRTGTSYYCHDGKLDGVAIHGHNWVREAAILPAIRAEADRLRIPFDAVALGQENETKRESLAERKRRVALAFADGALDEPTYREQLAAIESTVERLEAAAEIVEGVRLDWSAPVPVVNAALRAIFEYVQLAPDMTITEIRWRVPEWRS